MRKLILAALLSLISAIGIKAQSTDVSATVTDNASQAWIGGSYTFKSLSPQQAPFTGVLDGSGSFLVTLPHNQFTQAVNDVWTFSACPDVSIPSGTGCFTANITVFGPTQNITSQINAIAPSLTIPLFPAAISTIRAYNDAEIASTPKGGTYYNVVLSQSRVCTAVGGTPTLPTCNTWVANGGGGGPGGTPRLDQVLDPNANKSFNLGITTLSFINGSIDLSGLTAALKLPVIAGCTVTTAGQLCYDSTLGNWVIFNTAASYLPTLLQSGSYTTGDVLGISNVGGKITLSDLGPVNGGGGSTSFVQVTTTNLLNGDAICWDAATSTWINCTPGIPVSVIAGTTYTIDCLNDRGSYLLFTSSSAIAVTLPQASTSGNCDANFFTFIRTLHAVATVTPTTSTIDDGGGAGATLTLQPGYGFTITSDNSNYTARGGPYRESGNPLMSTEGFDVNTLGGYDWQSPNNASPGTAINKMACDDGTGKLQTCAFATAATNNPVGVAVTGIGAAPGTTGNTAICFIGFCKVFFDNAATANHFAQLSTTVNGDLSDTGATTPPTNGKPYWYIFASNSGSNTTGIVRDLSPSELSAVSVNGGGKTTVQINGTNTQPVVNFTTSGGLTLTPTNSGNVTTVAFTISATGGYATLQNAGSSITQRTTLNFIGAGSSNINCVDNAGQTRSDCTVTGINGPPSPTVNYQNGSAYTIQNSDNSFRDVFTRSGTVAVTLPQAGQIASSPFVATRINNVQQTCTNCTTGTFSQSAGNTMFFYLAWQSTSTVTVAPTDTAGDTWTLVQPCALNLDTTHQSSCLYKAVNVAASASNAISYTMSGSTVVGQNVLEYSGTITTDKVGQGISTASLPATVTLSNSNPTELVISFEGFDNSGCASGWTSRGSYAGIYNICEKIVNSASSTTYTAKSTGLGTSVTMANFGTTATATFTAGWYVTVENEATALVTVTPTTSTINVDGVAQTSLDITKGRWCSLMSDGTNYDAICGGTVVGLPNPAHQTAQTGAIGTTTLCAASGGDCNQAGQYNVRFNFIETGTACATPSTGGVTFLLTWTDTNGTAHSAVSLPMTDATSLTTLSQTFHFQTTLAAAHATGNFNISTNGTVIQYATGYTACGAGTGTYQLDASVTKLQY